jgi:hypothetical protein
VLQCHIYLWFGGLSGIELTPSCIHCRIHSDISHISPCWMMKIYFPIPLSIEQAMKHHLDLPFLELGTMFQKWIDSLCSFSGQQSKTFRVHVTALHIQRHLEFLHRRFSTMTSLKNWMCCIPVHHGWFQTQRTLHRACLSAMPKVYIIRSSSRVCFSPYHVVYSHFNCIITSLSFFLQSHSDIM